MWNQREAFRKIERVCLFALSLKRVLLANLRMMLICNNLLAIEKLKLGQHLKSA
jgi:hypothetical protein